MDINQNPSPEEGQMSKLKVGDRVKRVAAPNESRDQHRHFATHTSLGTIAEVRKNDYLVAWDERAPHKFAARAEHLEVVR